MSSEPKKVDRRKFIYAGLGAVALIAIGAAAYVAMNPPVVTQTVTTSTTVPTTSVVTTTSVATTTVPTTSVVTTTVPTTSVITATTPQLLLPINASKYKKAPSHVILDFYNDKGPMGSPYRQVALVGNPSFTEATDIEINPVSFSTTDVFQAAFYQVADTDKEPPIFNWWVGQQLRTIVKRGLCADLTSIWDAHKDEYSSGEMNPFSVDGVPYAIPGAPMAYWGVIWYRPQLFKQLGLKVPTTWDEFMSTARALKAAKVTFPIYCPFVEWTGFIWLQELIVDQDPDFYERLCVGKQKFTDDVVVNALKVFQGMVKEGLFGDVATGAAPGYSFYPPPPPLAGWWKNNQIGMILCGDWINTVFTQAGFKPFDDFDFFVLPKLKPSVGQVLITEPDRPLCIGAHSPKKEWAFEFYDFLMTPEAQAELLIRLQGLASDNIKIPREFQPVMKRKLYDILAQGKWRFELRIWEALPPEIIIPVSTLMDKLAFNPDQLDSIIKEMDTVATKYWSEHPS